MEVLERERQRNKAGGSGGLGSNSGGNPNDMTGGPGGMGKKSSSTSQLSAAGKVHWKCINNTVQLLMEIFEFERNFSSFMKIPCHLKDFEPNRKMTLSIDARRYVYFPIDYLAKCFFISWM